jgi:hypothetical protein
MRKSAGFVIAWIGATLVAVVIATAAVGSVRSEVTEAPTPLSSASAQALTTTPIATADVSVSSTTTATTTIPTAAPTSTIAPPGGTTNTTTTTTDASGTTPSTTVPPSTTTTVAPTGYSKTIDTVAGSVRILVDGTAVTFGGAYPKPGWKVELEEKGPEKVRVKFERNEGEGEIEVSARIEGGELLIDVDDHGESHDE